MDFTEWNESRRFEDEPRARRCPCRARAAAKARSLLRSLGNVHFVTGSPGDRRTLERAGAANAASVVYLARYGRGRVVEGAPPDTGGIIRARPLLLS